MSPSEHYFDGRAPLSGPLDPWLDDQTTTHYESKHLVGIRQAQLTGRRAPAAVTDLDALVWPDILEESQPARQVAHPLRHAAPIARASRNPTQAFHRKPFERNAPVRASRTPTLVTSFVQPPQGARMEPFPHSSSPAPPQRHGVATLTTRAERTIQGSSARPAAGRTSPLSTVPRVLPALAALDDAEEENPFARSSVLSSTWLRSTVAFACLFGAVLFGRVLLDAGKVPDAHASLPLSAAAADAALQPTPVALTLRGPITPELPAAAAAAPAQLRAAGNERPAKYRRLRATRTRTADTSRPRRVITEVSAREAKTSSSRPVVAGAGASKRTSSATGMLRINSRPWSQVFIDGRLFGNTPQLGIPLTPGKHNVRLVNAQFGMTKTIALKVAAGESLTRVEMLHE